MIARGITLDEIAEKLKVTPEYLGSQFHKEVGITFSAYIKEYRIQKAKKLLIGTELKLYKSQRKLAIVLQNILVKFLNSRQG